MKLFKKITNGIILILIGIIHIHLVISPEGCQAQFIDFSKSYFFKISEGMDELPALAGKTNFESFAAFWFFYFGLILIPLGLLVHGVEINCKRLPHSFTLSYFVMVLVGSYMVPNSGMIFIMLPHAVFMMVMNYIRTRKLNKQNQE